MQPDSHHPQIGEHFDRLKGFNYVADDYIAETRSSNVIKAIHVDATSGLKDPVKETEWLQAAADRTGFPHGIAAQANLKDPGIEEILARHAEYPNARGIRQDQEQVDYLDDPAFRRGYALLEKFNYVCNLDIKWEEMRQERDLAMKFPNTPLVLDHAGFPLERTDEYFNSWRRAVSDLAQAENVWCKISGLGMCDWNWTVESIRPWVMHCIEAFGPERSFFGTNWPVDRLFSTYDAVIEAYTEIISDFSRDEQVAMFSGNAEKLYRI